METNKYEELLKYLQTGEIPERIQEKERWKDWAETFTERLNHVYWGDKRLIPRYETTWIISMFHDDPTMAHQNAETTLQHIKERYIWPGMRKDVQEYVKTCYECQQRGSQKENNRKRTIKVNDIFERWGIDIVGLLPATE